MNLLIAVFLILSSISSISAQNTAKCDPQDSLFGNKCYRFVNQIMNFTSAVSYCRGIGYSLTSIHSMFENNFLKQQSENVFDKTHHNFHIGLYSPSKNTNSWVFVDGSAYDFNNWNNGEPSGSRWYVAVRVSDGKWVTVSNSASIPFVCSATSNNTSPASTTVAPMTTRPSGNACSVCTQPPPKVLQPGDSGAKCTNAPILESFTVADQVDETTCRYYVECTKPASIVAHLSDGSSCLTGLDFMYYSCINSTWMAEFRGNYYPGVDQLYCYESDENSCSKCPEPIQPLQPGGQSKCYISSNQIVTDSTLDNVTMNNDDVCMYQVMCSDSSSGTWMHLIDIDSNPCRFTYNLDVTYACFKGKWAAPACDDETCQSFSYHEIDEIYCTGPKNTTALKAKEMTKP